MQARKFAQFRFIVRDIYSMLFLRYNYVVAGQNKIYNPVLLWNKHLPTCILRGLLRTHVNNAVTDRQTKFVNKPIISDLSVRLIKT